MNKNKCPYCGGQLAISYQGNYSSIYKLKKDGEPYKRRYKRIIGDENDAISEFIYCLSCLKEIKDDVYCEEKEFMDAVGKAIERRVNMG